MNEAPLLLAFYADDFTGATDALEWLERAGVRTTLWLGLAGPPAVTQIPPGVQAIGVAGRTRALPPEEIAAELRDAFVALRALRPRHVHYKVCSTFDSSPRVGSIGRAIDTGVEVFGATRVPVLGGAPALGRFCVFGNLFARDGIGSTRAIHRLDRHPVMRRHPVTPAEESDLRLHLGRQTARPIGLIDVRELEGDEAALARAWGEQREVVLLDALDSAHLTRIGRLLEAAADAAAPLFSVGPSSVEQALGAVWAERDRVQPREVWPSPEPARTFLVVSGSCSPVTERQIAAATAAGFAEVALAPSRLAGPGAPDATEEAIRTAVRCLTAGRRVVVHTLGGGRDSAAVSPVVVGRALGRVAAAAVEQAGLTRLLIAGGDTSGEVARTLGIEALELIAPLTPGAPLCRVRGAPPLDGLEVVVKGGQVGADDHFPRVAEGLS